jgi:hypothetical protein
MKRSGLSRRAVRTFVGSVSWLVPCFFLCLCLTGRAQESQPLPASQESRPATSQSPFAPSRLPQHEIYRCRFGPDKEDALRKAGAARLHASVIDGLEWLRKHQDDDGHWDAEGFMKHDREGLPCTGAGIPVNNVGVTALAALAFLGDGNTMREGPYAAEVRNAIKWLVEQQAENGLIGTVASHTYIYSHAIASLALCEAYGLSEHKVLRAPAQKAIEYIQSARNPYKVWRYFPRDGDNDTSVTSWMVMALKTAEAFKLKTDADAFKASALWFDQVTDPASGRAGYTRVGEGSSRKAGTQMKFPAGDTEVLTAAGLLCRFFLGQDPKTRPMMQAAADTLLAKLPASGGDGSLDLYYWYWGTLAMRQMEGDSWKAWNAKMQEAVSSRQRKDGNFKGSWDALDAWSEDGGRVYATALMVLCLESSYRYAKL